MDFHKLYGLVNQLLRELFCTADGFHQREPLVVLGHCLSKFYLPLNRFIQPPGKVGILLIVGFLGKGVFLFIENAFREVLIEPSTLLGDAAEFQRKVKFAEAMSEDNKWLTLMKSVSGATMLSQELVDESVELVKVHEDGSIELVMKYGDIYALTVQSIKEVQEAM